MKTKAYKLSQIGPVKIGNGFEAQGKRQRNLRPKNSLAEFLNVNPDNTKEVMQYSQEYKWIPTGELVNFSIDWIKKFKEDQSQIKEIYLKWKDNNLTEQDIDLINSKLKGAIDFRVALISEKSIIQTNEELQNKLPGDNLYFNINNSTRKRHIIRTKKYASSTSVLWDELLDIMTENSKLKNCLNCGIFFIPTKRSKNQKYCSNTCTNNHGQRKRYHDKKDKN